MVTTQVLSGDWDLPLYRAVFLAVLALSRQLSKSGRAYNGVPFRGRRGGGFDISCCLYLSRRESEKEVNVAYLGGNNIWDI